MFGDYNTNITEGKLTRYSRHLSGFKAEYLGERFQAIAFGAETNQGFCQGRNPSPGHERTLLPVQRSGAGQFRKNHYRNP